MEESVAISSITNYSINFFNELGKTESVVASPLSVEYLLALLTLGSTDPAHEEILSVLKIEDDNAIRSTFSMLTSKLKGTKGVTVDVANKVYLMKGLYDFQPELKRDAVKIFDAAFEKVDFGNSSVAVNTINKWVESKTNEKIKDLLAPDSVDVTTKLVLVNALYFKGTWQKQFDPNDTRDMSFYLHPLKTALVATMQIEDHLWYGDSRDLDAQLLRLYYEGKESYMLIILPHDIDGLNGVLNKLSKGFDLLAEIDKMCPRLVTANIPKFKIETTIDLCELLPQLGIEAIFDPSCSGLTKLLNADEPLYVTKAIQKAFIEVNEEGAEAAAATAMAFGFALSESGPTTYTFYADRPFLSVIFVNGVPQFLAAYRGDG